MDRFIRRVCKKKITAAEAKTTGESSYILLYISLGHFSGPGSLTWPPAPEGGPNYDSVIVVKRLVRYDEPSVEHY